MFHAQVRFQINSFALTYQTLWKLELVLMLCVAMCSWAFTLDRRAFSNLETNRKVTWCSSPRAWFISRSHVRFLWRLWLHMQIDFLTEVCSIEVIKKRWRYQLRELTYHVWGESSPPSLLLRHSRCPANKIPLSSWLTWARWHCQHPQYFLIWRDNEKNWQNLRWRPHSLKRKTTPMLPLAWFMVVLHFANWS